jgi:hypothetical protein
MQALAAAINVPIDQIKLISTEAVEWPNGCLGVVRMGVMCTQNVVPGFRLVLEANGKSYGYHTNQDGSIVADASQPVPNVHIAVRALDNSIQVIDTKVPIDPPNPPTASGVPPMGGANGDTIYALDFADKAHAVAVAGSVTHTLDFIQNPSYGLAVLSGDAPRLSWATSPTGDKAESQLLVSNVDGSQLSTLVAENINGAPYQLVAQRWSRDGQAIYYSKEPYGIGGYIPFAGASSLYRLNVSDKSVKDLIPFDLNGGKMLCIDDLSADERLVAQSCDKTAIVIQDLTTNQSTQIQPPSDAAGFRLLGSARFDANATRVAFALAKGDPSGEQGWVAVSDGLSGASKLIATSQPGEYFTVVGWLNGNTLLIQSNALLCNPTCISALWTLSTDGNNLTQITQGTFLAIVN